MKKLLIAIIVVLPLVILGWAGIARFRPSCGEQTVVQQMSPDGRYMAAWMIRSCSASSYVDHINFRLLSENFHASLWDGSIKSDEIFTLDTRSGRVVSLAWDGSRRLIVKYQSAEPGPRRKHSWHDVTIEYPNH